MNTTQEIIERAVRVKDVGRLDLVKIDPYRRDTGTAAAVQLWLDPSESSCLMETYSPGQGVPAAECHGRNLTICVDSHCGPVDGPAVVEWLRGDEGQGLLARVCDGHSVEWDGNNRVGQLDADAQAALDALEQWLSDAPALIGDCAGLWSAGDWLDGIGRAGVCDEYGITAETTDERLAEIVAQIDGEAEAENVVLTDTDSYVTELRDDA